ncbi:glycoside hydrolase [Dendrothele bispora CBS 962.96]|uniref:Glycoside hydrolase n=1 Tax=Dendrothele bispora (strain CBS 962.96) TaxID=1314807 RepID=A0A4S8LCX1_DENBC|nr:glycoside hydrolase [Dendrothele bispora CBS 962.96]
MQLYWLLLVAPSPALGAIFTGWYTGWHASDIPLSSVSWSKYTHMTYAFAIPDNDPSTLLLTPDDEQLLPQFVQTAHQHGVKALLSIGGWTGSRFFSSNVARDESRQAFVNATLSLAQKYGLDGLDFDWEFPNRQGIGCNSLSPSSDDVPNFLTYLQQIRQDPRGSSLILSAAVPIQPYNWNFTQTNYFTSTFLNPSNTSFFTSSSGGDSTNSTSAYGANASIGPSGYLSGFSNVLDFIEIMNYDVWNPAVPYAFSTGPNEPFVTRTTRVYRDGEGNQGKKRGSAKTSVDAWIDAGIPKEKIVLGVAAYGHSFVVKKQDAMVNNGTGSGSGSSSSVSSSSLSSLLSIIDGVSVSVFLFLRIFFEQVLPPNSNNSLLTPLMTPLSLTSETSGTLVKVKTHVGTTSLLVGLYAFRGLIEQGYLDSNGQQVQQGEKMVYRWDDCSQTSFVYNMDNETMVSYDDSRSFTAKGSFIASTGLAGFAMWEVGGDVNDILLDSIRNAITNSSSSSANGNTRKDSGTNGVVSFRAPTVLVGSSMMMMVVMILSASFGVF